MLYAAAQRLEAQELILAIAAALLALLPIAATAQTGASVETVAADPALRSQAEALVPVLAGGTGYDKLFAAPFQAAVPLAQWNGLTAQLREAMGAPQRIATLVPANRWSGTITVAYERGEATMLIAVDPAAPHAITGLRITGTRRTDDSLAKVQAEVMALPGTAQIGVYALDGAQPTPVLAVRDATPAPLGSTFKLWVLAEAARQVAAGTRRWDDVVPLGPTSLPSGITQAWPARTPMTLQALATLMISISDNTATDTLIATLGRAPVDAMAARFGGSGPVLTTREAFVLKSDPALIAAWAKGDAAARRALLRGQAVRIAAAKLDPMMFSAGPLASDTVEWFAAPRDVARLLAHLRDAGPVVRGILSVNHGIAPASAARFAYVGFKGGSEPGVLSLNVLAQTKAGRWYAVSAAWHRPNGAVDEAVLLALTTRALEVAAGR